MDADWFEKIEDYLSGKLSPEEQRQFEATMAANEGRAAAFVTYQAIEQEMHSNEYHKEQEAALKTTLQQLNARYFNTNAATPQAAPETGSAMHKLPAGRLGRVRGMGWVRYAVAASLLGLVALGMIWYQKQAPAPVAISKKDVTAEATNPADTTAGQEKDMQRHSAQKKAPEGPRPLKANTAKQDALFAAYFKPDALPQEREGPLEDAFAAYEKKNYKETVAAIDNAGVDVATRGDEADKQLTVFYASYYKALSFMAAGAVAKALPLLQKALAQSPDNASKTKVQWYLALGHVKTGNPERATTLLNQIIRQNTSSVYQSKARSLQSALSSN